MAEDTTEKLAEVEETPAAAAPETDVKPGPWAADLTEYFGDNPEAIAAADRYMREKVQPRITHLETESAPARELYTDLLNDADTTLATVVEEIYGEDVAGKFKEIFAQTDGSEEAAEEALGEAKAGAEDEVPAWAKPLLEDHESRRDEALREQQASEYQEVLAELQEAHPDLDETDMGLIHPFMSAAGGDIERAYAGYQAYTEAFKARHGVTPAEAEEKPEAPTVLSGDGPAATPPVQKNYTWAQLDEAISDFQAENRKQAPPPVL